MPRVRVSTTVDETLLTTARQLRAGLNDAALLDE
ncbi:MAG: antitoxin, partial [Actinomycetia bacterium]|nr:antitoxin [Actinomycetes bacterium]